MRRWKKHNGFEEKSSETCGRFFREASLRTPALALMKFVPINLRLEHLS